MNSVMQRDSNSIMVTSKIESFFLRLFNILVIGDRYKTQSEIRRKSSINEAYEFDGKTTFTYNMKGRRSRLWMQIAVSGGE